MTISSTNLVDDNFKVINKITGARNEDEKLIELDNLKGSTNESKISVANVYYEVVNEKVNNVEQDGKVTLQFDDSDPFLTLQGKDNYGLKPTEAKIKPESGSGNIKVKTGTKLKNFSLILECHKESGFTTI